MRSVAPTVDPSHTLADASPLVLVEVAPHVTIVGDHPCLRPITNVCSIWVSIDQGFFDADQANPNKVHQRILCPLQTFLPAQKTQKGQSLGMA